MSEYYSFVQRDWDLSIRLNDEIMEPEEFKERADNPSSFRLYPVNSEQDLAIYHNQPINKHKIGLIDLKDKSILDCNIKIADENLVLSFKDRSIVRIENWSAYSSVREMMFAFNDTKIFNMKCIVSNCNPEEIIEEFRKEKIKLVNKNSAAENPRTLEVDDIPGIFSEEKENEESTQRHKHHRIRHEGHHRGHRDRRNIKNDNFVIESNKATSRASKQFSWVNAFANTVVSAARGVISFLFKLAIGTKYSQPSKTVTTQGVDISSTLFLLDVLIRKITDQKYIAIAGQPTSLLEARDYAVEITTEFERILENTAKRSGISAEKLGFDIPGVQKAIEVKIINGELSKIPVVLCSAIGKAYPKNEKFLSILKGNIEKVLSRQQIVNSGNKEQDVAVNNKVPLSSFNSIIVEPASDKGLREVM